MRPDMPDPAPDDAPQDPEPRAPLPPAPEVRPDADDPVREHTAGDEPVPLLPDPRLRIEFF